jgi:hypothetical protein
VEKKNESIEALEKSPEELSVRDVTSVQLHVDHARDRTRRDEAHRGPTVSPVQHQSIARPHELGEWQSATK